jgi:hypothetical protein
MIHIHDWKAFKTYTGRLGYECIKCSKKRFPELKRKVTLYGKEICSSKIQSIIPGKI